MQLYISIKDDKSDLFLKILNEFKNDMVEKYHIIKSNYIDDEEQKEIEALLDNRTDEEKEIAYSKTVQIEI